MSKYINADDYKELIEREMAECYPTDDEFEDGCKTGLGIAVEVIDEMSPADVVEVKQGMTMSKYINAYKLIKAIENELWDWETVNSIKSSTVLRQTISDIGNQPSADVVEVVRCKGCKFYDSERTAGLNGYCEVCRCYKEADGFCNCGERKDSE